MRILATLSAAFLFTFMLATVPAFPQEAGDKPQAQDEKAKDKDKDRDRDRDKNQARPDDRGARQDNKAMRQDEGKRNEPRPDARQNETEHPAAARPQENNRQEQRPDEHADRDRDRDRQQHPVRAQRGKRIPEQHFRQSFGREHRFHVDRTRVVNVSQPVVVYGGYSFQLVDAWPAEWSYDDDCYIDYVDDGYYLFDAEHPGIRIAVYVAE
jgi:hypothetical protein